ncbi:MAG: YciI family protein [Melioribacteraceae bacterium]|nr:YciI family protein [Melioribacteraceae bacterium]
MKHFVVEIEYIIEIEEIANIRPMHRKFLDTGYEKGIILMSGPQSSGNGGIIIARANSKEELMKFLDNDPYQINQAANYKYIEFDPRNHQQILSDWID